MSRFVFWEVWKEPQQHSRWANHVMLCLYCTCQCLLRFLREITGNKTHKHRIHLYTQTILYASGVSVYMCRLLLHDQVHLDIVGRLIWAQTMTRWFIQYIDENCSPYRLSKLSILIKCVLQVALIQALPSCLGQTENNMEELQILCIQIACLEFTIHMQTLTLATIFKTDTVLGATRQHFALNNQHN